METSLHRQLKIAYAGEDSQTEVKLGRFRIDAIRGDELIEIQCASLGALRDKVRTLTRRHQLRIVKPIVTAKRIAKRGVRGGPILSRRRSPKRGDVLTIFEDLIHFTSVFPHRNLVLEVLPVQVEEVRGPAGKRRGRWKKRFAVEDVRLEEIGEAVELRTAVDLLELLKLPKTREFNTADLAASIGRPRWLAQQIAYVLRETGAAETTGRTRAGIGYRRTSIAGNTPTLVSAYQD